MIVICTRCQAKFRVADDKVGPRGAKVRCSKCQTVFLVHPDLGSIPTDQPAVATAPPAARAPPRPAHPAATGLDVDLESRTPGPSPTLRGGADPFAAALAGPGSPFAAADPFAAAAKRPRAVGAASPDPFAAAADSLSADDPFDASPAPAPRHAAATDPFAAPADPLAAPAPTPFAAPSDPFAPLAPEGPAGPPAAFASEPSLADDLDPFGGAAGRDPALVDSADPLSGGDPGLAGDPFGDGPAFAGDPFAATVARDPGPGAAAEIDYSGDFAAPGADELSAAGADDFSPAAAGADLALEDRHTPGPAPLHADPSSLPGPDADQAVPFADPSEVSFASTRDDASLSLAIGAAPPAAVDLTPPPVAPRAPTRAAAMRASEERAAAHAADDEAHDAAAAGVGRIPGGRASRVRSVAVNALALAALLLVALAIHVVWRGDGALGPGALRPAAVLAAIGHGDPAPFAAVEVRSGLYERAAAPPVLFVRGAVVSRAPGPVHRVRVAVELTRGGRVLARGAATAGAVPSPEELHGAGDAAALEALAAAVVARAPDGVRPGDTVPFVVALGDAPADLTGASIRVSAEAEE
jgi:predicted Zn finger-like uncharacterized protein